MDDSRTHCCLYLGRNDKRGAIVDAVGASNALGVIKVTMPSKVIALHCNEYNGLYSTPFARRVVDEETDTQGVLVPGTSVLLSKCSKPTKRSRKEKTLDRFWISFSCIT